MNEQWERHGDASAVFDCLKYHASAGEEYEYRGTLALEAFDRICTTLLDVKRQRDELFSACKSVLDPTVCVNESYDALEKAIANAEKHDNI